MASMENIFVKVGFKSGKTLDLSKDAAFNKLLNFEYTLYDRNSKDKSFKVSLKILNPGTEFEDAFTASTKPLKFIPKSSLLNTVTLEWGYHKDGEVTSSSGKRAVVLTNSKLNLNSFSDKVLTLEGYDAFTKPTDIKPTQGKAVATLFEDWHGEAIKVHNPVDVMASVVSSYLRFYVDEHLTVVRWVRWIVDHLDVCDVV